MCKSCVEKIMKFDWKTLMISAHGEEILSTIKKLILLKMIYTEIPMKIPTLFWVEHDRLLL